MQVNIIMVKIIIIILVIILLHQLAQSKGEGDRRVMEILGQQSLCSEKMNLGLKPETLP